MFLRIVLLLLISGYSLFSQSRTYISGPIQRNTEWAGDVYIDGDVIVQKGVVLSIQPGSRIIIKPNSDTQAGGQNPELTEIIVLGKIIARGRPQNGRIIFTSHAREPRMSDWYGISIKNLNEQSILEYCLIEYGYKGITCYGSSPVIQNSEVRFNYYAGISCEIRSRPEILHTTILGNDFAGLSCELASYPKVESCIITQNTNGVIAFDRSEPDLGHWNATPTESRGRNQIFNNFEYNIYNHAQVDMYAQNNMWNTRNLADIRLSIYDLDDNPGYGKVIFLPLFGQPAPLVRSEAPRVNEQSPAKQTTQPPETLLAGDALSQPPPDTATAPPPESIDTLASEIAREPIATQPVKVETVFVYKQPEVEKEPPKAEPAAPQEPIIEGLLDGGSRQYLRRVKPSYPEIYRKTGKEGVVIMEVIVDEEGRVESYRILKSDGDLFSAEAAEAVQKFLYKPGTFKNRPVKFKVVERFKFKL